MMFLKIKFIFIIHLKKANNKYELRRQLIVPNKGYSHEHFRHENDINILKRYTQKKN